MTFQMSILRDLVYGAAARGVNFNQLCDKAGIKPESLNDGERMIDWEMSPFIWDHIVQLSGDEFAGLHMGEDVRPSVFGVMGHLLQTCKNLQEVLEAIAKYGKTWSTIFNFDIEKKDSLVYFYFDPVLLYKMKYPNSARQATEICVSGTLRILKILSGKNIYPEKLFLAYPKRDLKPYQNVCQCDIDFNAERSHFIFREEQLTAHVLGHDSSLFFMFNNILEQKKKILDNENTMSVKIQQMLISEFKGQVPPIDVIAAKLCLTKRTLQRKLAEEKVTYRELTQALQKHISTALISQKNHSITDVALLMGYVDYSTFRRAFKKWK